MWYYRAIQKRKENRLMSSEKLNHLDRDAFYAERIQPKLAKIERLARRGKSKQEIAARIGVGYGTLMAHARDRTELNEALISGYRAAGDKVVKSLLQTAIGYTVKEKTTIYDDENNVVETRVKEKYIPPLHGAQVRFLKMIGEFDTVDEQLKSAQIRNTTAEAKIKEKVLNGGGDDLPPIMQWLGQRTLGVEDNDGDE